MLSGPVALFGCKADKILFIPLGCICICSRSGNGDGPIVGTLVVSSSLYLVNDRNTSISADEKNLEQFLNLWTSNNKFEILRIKQIFHFCFILSLNNVGIV